MSAHAYSARAKRRLKLCTAIVSLGAILPAGAQAQSVWTGAVDNDFSNGANWNPTIPGPTDTARIGTGAATLSTDTTVDRMDVRGDGELDIDATLQAAGGTTVSETGQLDISATGRLQSDVEMTDGLITNAGTIDGNVTMSDGTLANSGTLDGSLTMSGGETVNDGRITGTATLSDGKLTNNFSVTDVDVAAAAEFVNNTGANAGRIANAGTASNAGTIAALTNTGGNFTNNSGGEILGSTTVTGGTVTNNFRVTAVDVAAAAEFVNNSTGQAGAVANAGRVTNAGTIASLTNTGGTFTNNSGGEITGDAVVTGGTLTNNFIVTDVDVAAAAEFINNATGEAGAVTNAGRATNAGTIASLTNTGGTFTNNSGGEITGATTVTGGTVVNNFVVTAVDVAAAANFVNNSGATAGAVTNAGSFSNAGTVASLTNTGGTFANTGTIIGDADVTGGTLVNDGAVGGTIEIGEDGTLTGGGALGGLTVGSGGTFSPGPGIATVAVDGDVSFREGSTYQVDIDDAGLSDRIDAVGAITIDGGTVEVTAGPGTYMLGATYTIMTGDTVDGTFDEVTSDFAFLDPILSYDPQAITLSLERNTTAFADVTETRNTRATAQAVEALGQIDPVFLGVLPLNVAAARDAFDQLSGEIHGSLKSQLLEQSSLAREAVIDRLRGDVPVKENEGGASVWITGVGSRSRMDDDGNASELEADLGGVFVGLDGDVSDAWRIGGLFGYTNTSAGTDADWDTFHAGLYAAAEWGKLNFTGGAIYSHNEISVNRSIAFGAFEDDLKTDYSSATRQIFADLGWREKAGPLTLEPFANLAYVNLDTDGFAEEGGAAALSATDGTDGITFATLGLRWSADIGTPDLPVTIAGMAGWRHAFGDLTPSSRFAFSAGSPFLIEGVSLSRDTAIVEASLSARITQTARLKFGYAGEFSGAFASHAAKASLVIDF